MDGSPRVVVSLMDEILDPLKLAACDRRPYGRGCIIIRRNRIEIDLRYQWLSWDSPVLVLGDYVPLSGKSHHRFILDSRPGINFVIFWPTARSKTSVPRNPIFPHYVGYMNSEDHDVITIRTL